VQSLGAAHLVELELAGGTPPPLEALRALPGVAEARVEATRVSLGCSAIHETVPAVLALMAAHGAVVADLSTHSATLEDVFVSLTGRHLRDA
jgi:ABC-2 type transport system ATP-binding protein